MARLDALNVTFHAKLGTQGERVTRIRALARDIAPLVGADPALAMRAAVLAKADLTTEIVGEFPELQGGMGRKYALLQNEHPFVAAAIEEHYKPQGPCRFRTKRSGVGRGRTGRQTRHACRLLGNRRKADRLEGPVRSAACRSWRYSPVAFQRLEIRTAATVFEAAFAQLREDKYRTAVSSSSKRNQAAQTDGRCGWRGRCHQRHFRALKSAMRGQLSAAGPARSP